MHGSGGLTGHSEDCWTLICALQPCAVTSSSHRVRNLQSISEGQEKRKNSSRCCSEDMQPVTSYTAGRCCTPKPIEAAVTVSLHRNVHRGGSARDGITASLKKPMVCCLGSLKLPCAGFSWCETQNGRAGQCFSSCTWGCRYQQWAEWAGGHILNPPMHRDTSRSKSRIERGMELLLCLCLAEQWHIITLQHPWFCPGCTELLQEHPVCNSCGFNWLWWNCSHSKEAFPSGDFFSKRAFQQSVYNSIIYCHHLMIY